MIDLKSVTTLKSDIPGVEKKALKIKDTVLNFVFPVLIFVISILLTYFVTLPSYKSSKEKISTLNSKSTILTEEQKKLDNLKKLSQNKSLLDSDNKVLDSAIQENKKVPEYFEQLSRVAAASVAVAETISYTSATAGSTEVPQAYTEISVSVNLRIPKNGLYSQLYNLENSLRLSKVSSVNFSFDENEEDGEASANIVVTSPFLEFENNKQAQNTIASKNFDIFDSGFRSFVEKLSKSKDYASEIDKEVEQTTQTPQPIKFN